MIMVMPIITMMIIIMMIALMIVLMNIKMILVPKVEESESGGVRLSLRSQELLLGEREVG